jgi:hypothetical protein
VSSQRRGERREGKNKKKLKMQRVKTRAAHVESSSQDDNSTSMQHTLTHISVIVGRGTRLGYQEKERERGEERRRGEEGEGQRVDGASERKRGRESERERREPYG